jgi:hypothetical protein
MKLKTKIYLPGFVLVVALLVIVPIRRSHQYYHLTYAEILYNLLVDHRFGPK